MTHWRRYSIRYRYRPVCVGVVYNSSDRTPTCRQTGSDMAAAERKDQTEAALRERVKELTCLYGIAQIAQLQRNSLQDLLPAIAGLLPPPGSILPSPRPALRSMAGTTAPALVRRAGPSSKPPS